MEKAIKEKIIAVCNKKITQKGEDVGLSFYAFFANKNDNPELLMEVAHWWIMEHKLNHFEKALKIKNMMLINRLFHFTNGFINNVSNIFELS
jgi:hypothetical protein